ncbi:hypothetical protein DY000_02005498 [Brassica cretica]|uniref:Uncharacterized protein n=1 Tax=Brassica cretica TaxID=69181 RepID=A0ABQ7BSM0_BRACR|nr:hypothetical protein DY000_02005498 [Brassica cretica]
MVLFRVPSLASASKCGVLASDAEKISVFDKKNCIRISSPLTQLFSSPTFELSHLHLHLRRRPRDLSSPARALCPQSRALSSPTQTTSSLFSDADHELSHLRRSPRAISSLTLITGSLISEAYHELSHI